MVSGQTPWRTLGDLDYPLFLHLIPDGSPMLPEAKSIYAAVKGQSALYAAHALHESEWGTTGVATTGIFNALGNKDHAHGGYMEFRTWTEGAAWWKQHVLDPTGPYAQTVTIAQYVHVYAPASDGNDESRYVQVICDIGNKVTPSPGAHPMSYTVSIPGLPGGPVELPFPLDTKTYMIPASNTYQNPGIRLTAPYRWVQHATGNPNSLARGDANWVCNQSAADGFQESMHFEVDDKEGFQLIVGGFVSWQAADGPGPGNMSGWSCEMSANAVLLADPTRRANMIRNCAVLGGIIAARVGIAKPEYHYTFNYMDPNRHFCPEWLLTHPDDKASYEQQWYAAKAAELARMQGQPAPKPIKWVTPTPVKGLPDFTKLSADTSLDVITNEGTQYHVLFDVYEAQGPAHRFKRATGYQSDQINETFQKGDRILIVVDFNSKTTTAKPRWGLTEQSTRIWLDGEPWKRVADAPTALA